MRIFFSVITLALVIVAPYWVYLPAIILGIIFMPLYLEAIVLALLADTLYGSADSIAAGFPFGALAALLVLFAQPLREHLRFNA